MQRITLSWIILLLLFLLVSCGKKQKEEEKKDTPTPSETVSVTAEPDPVTPTAEPEDDGEILRRMVLGFRNVVNSGNYTFTYKYSYESDGETNTVSENTRLSNENGEILLYKQDVDWDGVNSLRYAWLTKDGGVRATAYFDKEQGYKLVYDLSAYSDEDVKYYYPVLQGLTSQDGSPLTAITAYLSNTYPGWPDSVPGNDKAFAVKEELLLSYFASEENLASVLGYYKSEDGKHCFHISADQLLSIPGISGAGTGLSEAVQTVLWNSGYAGALWAQELDVTVEFDGKYLSLITLKYIDTDGDPVTEQFGFADVGTTTVAIPDAMSTDFNSVKAAYRTYDRQTHIIADKRQRFNDIMDGSYAKDNELLTEIINGLYDKLQNPEFNAKVVADMGDQTSVLMYFREGEVIARKTGIATVDKFLQDTFGDRTFTMAAAENKRILLSMQIRIQNGVAQNYYAIDYE